MHEGVYNKGVGRWLETKVVHNGYLKMRSQPYKWFWNPSAPWYLNMYLACNWIPFSLVTSAHNFVLFKKKSKHANRSSLTYCTAYQENFPFDDRKIKQISPIACNNNHFINQCKTAGCHWSGSNLLSMTIFSGEAVWEVVVMKSLTY